MYVTMSEVLEVVKELPNRKSSELDGLNGESFKHADPICVASLQKSPHVAIYHSSETRSGVLYDKSIPVFSSTGQNYFTAFYVSKNCFASVYLLFKNNLNYKQLFLIIM